MQHELISPTETWLQSAIDAANWREPLETTARFLNARATLLAWSLPGDGLAFESSASSPSDFVQLCRKLAGVCGDTGEQHEPGLGWLTWAGAHRGAPQQRVTLFALSDEPIAHQSLQAMAASAAGGLTIRVSLDATRTSLSLMTRACDQLCAGVVIVNAELKVVAHNETWRGLLSRQDGLSSPAGKLVCRNRADQEALATAVTSVLTEHLDEATVKVRRAGGMEPYVLRASTAGRQSNIPGLCLLMVVDPDLAPTANGEIWRAMFELTDCELIIAEALLSGRRISEVATRRGVSRETVRTQTKRMFARLGVSSQVEAAVRLSRTTPFRSATARREA